MGSAEIVEDISSVAPRIVIESPKEDDKEEKRSYKEEKEEVYDRLQLVNNLKNVENQIKEVLGSDFVLASFSQEQKEYIADMLKDAYFARNTLIAYQSAKKYHWDNKKKDWDRNEDGSYKKVGLNDEEKKKIKDSADNLFRSYMIEPLSLAVLERNKKGNFILNLLVKGSQEKEEEEKQEAKEEAQSIAQRIYDKMSGKGEGEE
ncbi:hypothetical protein GF336_00385 [Candidatus Woesearchaeota archaeon]|nr:hypothetical protein [Candidatus Woesearchaeota archaeon]